MVKKRSGPWSTEDRKFIDDNYDTMAYEDIADKIGRSPKIVKRYIRSKYGDKVISRKSEQLLSQEYNIKKSIVWKELRSQFSSEELKKFLHHWEKIVGQFKEDILATEEMQVVDYLRLDLLMDRLLSQQQQNLLELQRLEKDVEDEIALGEDKDSEKIASLNSQIAMRRTAQGSLTREFKDLYAEKGKTLQQMKATREARIKFLESSKESFLGWVKQVVMDDEFRNRMGKYMTKMALAMKKEEERLSHPHTYIDGQTDLPMLSIESYNKWKTTTEQQENTDSQD